MGAILAFWFILTCSPTVGAQDLQTQLSVITVIHPTVAEAEAFYDWISDKSKKTLFQSVASTYDPMLRGRLIRPLDPPKRFGLLRLYPRGYDLARRVASMPFEEQQTLYSYLFAHQVRSGWIRPAADAILSHDAVRKEP